MASGSPEGEDSNPPPNSINDDFADYVSGRLSIDTGDVWVNKLKASDPLRWAAQLIRAHATDSEEDRPKLQIAHDLEIVARGYGQARILPLDVPKKRRLKRGERRDQIDAHFFRDLLVLSVYAEHGRRQRKGSLIDLAIDNGFSEDRWRKWSSKTDKSLREQSRKKGIVVTWRGEQEPIPPKDWPTQIHIIDVLMNYPWDPTSP